MRVLCIDDDPDVLETMRMYLEKMGCKVDTAGSAKEGLSRFDELKPELVFVDLMMEEPDSGLRVVRHIQGSASPVPVYILSTVGESLCSLTDCSSFKVDDVLQKPINPKVLTSLIESKLKKI